MSSLRDRPGEAGVLDATRPRMPAESRRRALVNAAAAVRSTDPASVESALKELGGRRRWLTPLAYAAGTVAVVFDGVLLLIRNWRLTLLQLVPALWISAMTWNLRHPRLRDPRHHDRHRAQGRGRHAAHGTGGLPLQRTLRLPPPPRFA